MQLAQSSFMKDVFGQLGINADQIRRQSAAQGFLETILQARIKKEVVDIKDSED